MTTRPECLPLVRTWNDVARSALSAHGLGETGSARIPALMPMASVDSTIACHDSKYVYWVPRPTQADAEIRLATFVPDHPPYPTNHACISGTIGSSSTRNSPISACAISPWLGKQASPASTGGIHYRIDGDESLVIARRVAARALKAGVPADRAFVALGR